MPASPVSVPLLHTVCKSSLHRTALLTLRTVFRLTLTLSYGKNKTKLLNEVIGNLKVSWK